MSVFDRCAPVLDKPAASTSMFRVVHCVWLPVLLCFILAFGALVFGQQAFHVLSLWLVIPTSLVALSLGGREHNDRLVALFGVGPKRKLQRFNA